MFNSTYVHILMRSARPKAAPIGAASRPYRTRNERLRQCAACATGRERQVESDRSRATGRERQRQVESDSDRSRATATGRERQVESDRSKTARPGDRLGAHRNALPIGNDRQGVSTGDGSGWRYADISKARLNALVLSAAPTPSTTFSNLFSARCAPFRPRVRVSWSTANVTADHS
jgi:hypothetical protein